MFRLRILLGTLILAMSAAAHPAALAPTSKWIVDYAAAKCSASRTYGSDKDPTILGLVPSPSGRILRLMVAHSGGAREARHFKLDLHFSGRQVHTTGLRFGGDGKNREIVWITLDRARLEGLENTAEIGIVGRSMDEHFSVPGIRAVLKELDKCAGDLRSYWNTAPGVVATPAVPVRPLRQLFSDMDYPGQALEEELGGQTLTVMLIDETGSLKDCMLEQASGIASIDAMTCQVIREKAKFKPAADRQGKPIRSILSVPIRFQIASEGRAGTRLP